MIDVAFTVLMIIVVLVTTFLFLGVRFITALALAFFVGLLISGIIMRFTVDDPFDGPDRSRRENLYAACAFFYTLVTFILVIMAAWRESKRHFAK